LYKTFKSKGEGGRKWDANDGMTDKQKGRKTEGDRKDRMRVGRKSEKYSTKGTSHALLKSQPYHFH
jgi:hypothetical protein